MECRVGITQNPDEALSRWKEEHPTLRGWEILGEPSSKFAAQLESKRHAEEHGCVVCPDESGSGEDPWFVYCFTFGEVAMEIGLRDAEGEVCTVKSLQQLKKFLEDERQFWSEKRNGVLKSETSRAHLYLDSAGKLERYKEAIEGLINDSSTVNNDEFVQRAKALAAKIPNALSSGWLWSQRPYVSTYVMCNSQYGHDAADAFINYILNGSVSIQDRARFFGAMQGYEFSHHDESIASRRDGEKQSLDQLRKQFQDEIVEFQTQGSECKSNFMTWNDKAREQADNLHKEIKRKSNDQVRQYSKHFEESMSKWEEGMRDVESLYEEKLRLQKPAEYWQSAGMKYRRQGIGWMFLVGLISAVGLWWLAGTFDVWLRGAAVELSFNTLQGAVIFASLMAVFAFVARMLSRLAFSSFHLMRDAQEREQLTYLYLALSEKEPAVKESRDIVLRALFSRSQTGLLTDEHGPTMLAADVVRSDNK